MLSLGSDNMSIKRLGRQTVRFSAPPVIAAVGSVAGKKEREGPLGHCFDHTSNDSYFGEKSWEKAESLMQKKALETACGKIKLQPCALDYIFAGDLLNQCCASSFAMRGSDAPFFGLYGACSTFCEALSLAAMSIDGGFADIAAAVTSSHFCGAERQFRLPLEYGGQRTPTAQWTATAAGAAILRADGEGPRINAVTTGVIRDAGIRDANNMGAAMAPAAFDTLTAHFSDLGIAPEKYDLIATGDLGRHGRDVLLELFAKNGVDISNILSDCGMMLFSGENQDVHSGASGCGCSASVFCGYIYDGIISGKWKNVLLASTGALMSPTTSGQGESIPGICHAVSISAEKEAF